VGVKLLEWRAPGPYRVAFSTRLGGVSEGPFASLNLGILTADRPEHVVENRRRLAAAVGADPDAATMAWQVHGGDVTRAESRGIVTPGTPYERCDGLWSDRPGQAMVLVTADCFPVAIARANGRPALAVLHVGWRGLLAGLVDAGVRAVGEGRLAAVIGPGIGPCCYDVGEEVADRFRAVYGDDVVRGRKLDLRSATERALRRGGCESVETLDLCTSCEKDLFFSHRRDRGRTGRQGIIAYVE
jgi:YfiH family protein